MTITPAVTESGTVSILSTTPHGLTFRAFGTAAAPASTAWPTANQAYAIPFYVSTPLTVVEMFWISGTTPGTANIDLGIYRQDFTRIVNLGATAATNTTDALQPSTGGDITDTVLPRGRYYMAMSAAATSITVRATTQGNGLLRAIGMFQMASAHTLPTTFTPASMSTSTFFPVIGLTAVTNIL